MTFEADLYAHLHGDSSITAQVSTRIYPVKMPQNATRPAITYQTISGDPMTDLDSADGDLLAVRVQIDCWAETYTAAAALGEAVRTRLKTAATSFRMGECRYRDIYEDDARLFRRLLDVTCWYRTT